MDNLVTVTINGRTVQVPKGTNAVEAARRAGVEIPIFCYHSKLKPVGACRMCYVQIEKIPGVVTACTTTVNDGMIINTQAPPAVKAQKGVIEFLLANHPLDCPVCDRGGECPLQDNAFGYGGGVSRFIEPKRHYVKPIPLSQYVLLDRERCILCYRCVRFQNEIAGDETLTVINRGSASEIGTLPGREFDSPFSGNTIEICPVGALTSAKYRFKARPWDIRTTASVCDHCSVGCNVRADIRDHKIARLLSRENTPVDDGWFCDRGRFGYDFVNREDRLAKPMVRENGALRTATWEEALNRAARGLRAAVERHGAEAVGVLISPRQTNEEQYLARKIAREVLGTPNIDHRLTPHPTVAPLPYDAATGSIVGLEQSKAILLVDVDPINEQPVLDLRIKKAKNLGAKLIVIGEQRTDLTALSHVWLRPKDGTLSALLRGLAQVMLADGQVNQEFVEQRTNGVETLRGAVADATPERVAEATGVRPEVLKRAAEALATQGPAAIVYRRDLGGDADGALAVNTLYNLALLTGNLGREGAGLYPLVTAANEQGAIDLGIMPRAQRDEAKRGLSGSQMLAAVREGRFRALFVIGMDPIAEFPADEAIQRGLAGLETLVVQGILPGPTQELANVVLPGGAFSEKDGTLTNLERRVQRLRPAMLQPGEAQPDWKILRDLAIALGARFDYAQAQDVFAEIAQTVPAYAGLTFGKLGLQGVQWPLRPDEGTGSRVLYDEASESRWEFASLAPRETGVSS